MGLHRGAVAKALLAMMPLSDQKAYLKKIQPPLEPAALASLQRDLATIRATGLAESESEVDAGVWAVASPITVSGRNLGAVSVVAPTFHVDEASKSMMREKIQDAAAAISNAVVLAHP
jgi:DNA-binding IclR family transcriptional regulator